MPERDGDERAAARLGIAVAPDDLTPAELDELQADRPRTRADCAGGIRPCPWVSCKFNLFLEVTLGGGIKLNFPGIEPDEMAESCALDVAERGGMTLEAVGELTNLTRERIRQLEVRALLAMKRFRQLGGDE